MEVEWYYYRDGSQSGPMPLDTLIGLVESGYLRPTDLVWKDGRKGWDLASNIKEFRFPIRSPTSVTPGRTPVPQTAPPAARPGEREVVASSTQHREAARQADPEEAEGRPEQAGLRITTEGGGQAARPSVSGDPKRIDRVLAGIRVAWTKHPGLRLGQLIANVVRPDRPCPEIAAIEDEELLSKLSQGGDLEGKPDIAPRVAAKPPGPKPTSSTLPLRAHTSNRSAMHQVRIGPKIYQVARHANLGVVVWDPEFQVKVPKDKFRLFIVREKWMGTFKQDETRRWLSTDGGDSALMGQLGS